MVSLLSGRDFVTKEFREDIVEESYGKLDAGIMNFINQYNFSQFVMAINWVPGMYRASSLIQG